MIDDPKVYDVWARVPHYTLGSSLKEGTVIMSVTVYDESKAKELAKEVDDSFCWSDTAEGGNFWSTVTRAICGHTPRNVQKLLDGTSFSTRLDYSECKADELLREGKTRPVESHMEAIQIAKNFAGQLVDAVDVYDEYLDQYVWTQIVWRFAINLGANDKQAAWDAIAPIIMGNTEQEEEEEEEPKPIGLLRRQKARAIKLTC